MTTLILIAQTYIGVMAYEYGPYPDMATCERFATKRILEIEASGQVLKVMSDCRIMHPELTPEIQVTDLSDIE